MKYKKVSEVFKQRKKCDIYIRVSSERQVQGFSLDGQKRELIEYAKMKGLEVNNIYVEPGRSGKDIDGREEFQKMLNDVLRVDSEVGYILVFKLSRFGRNVRDILNTINLIHRYGISLLTKDEGIDSSSNMGSMLIAILGTVAEMERENISTQTMLGREEKAKQGGWNGGFAPYGYDIVDGKLVANENAYIVKMIYQKYIDENMGMKAIADYLNRNGIKKQRPKNKQDYKFDDWSDHTIKAILDNPVYTGYIAFGRRRTVKCINEEGEIVDKLLKQEDYITSDEQSHEALVSKELWDKAQQKRKSRAVRGNKRIGQAPKHLLSGILKCPDCGCNMVINYNKWCNQDGSNKQTRTYICGHYNRSGAHGQCKRNGVNAEIIEREVVNYTRKLISNPQFTSYVKEKIGYSTDVSEIEKEIESYEKKLKILERNKESLYKDIDNLADDDKIASRKREDMNKRLDNIYKDIEEIETLKLECEDKIDIIRKQEFNRDKIYEMLLHFDKIFDKLNDEEKQQLIQALVSKVELYKKDEIKTTKTYIKEITYAFDVFDLDTNFLGNKSNNVETVVKLSLKKDTPKIEVTMEPDEESNYTPEEKATYQKIKDYVKDKYGVNVHTSYIAQVKRMCGVDMGENYNKSKKENPEVKQCTQEKVEYIKDALRYFRLI